MQELIDAYLADAVDRLGWSAATVRAYRSHIKSFHAWYERRQDEAPTAAAYAAAHLQTYDTARKRAGRAQRTRSVEMCALQSFARFLAALGLVPSAALAAVERVRVRVTEKPKRVWATPEQVHALFEACEHVADHHSDLLAYRRPLAYAVLSCLAYCGMRRSEVCSLTVKDLALDATPPQLTVRFGKGDKSRAVWLAPDAVKHLRAWLAQRPVQSEHLFTVPIYRPGVTDESEMSVDRLVGIVRELARIARIPSKVPLACHAFRRCAATNLLKIPGAKLTHVQEFLGHSQLSTTLVYLAVETQELQQLVLQLDVETPKPDLRIVDGTAAPAVKPKAKPVKLMKRMM